MNIWACFGDGWFPAQVCRVFSLGVGYAGRSMRHGGQSPMDLDSVIEGKGGAMRPNNALQRTGGSLEISLRYLLSDVLIAPRRSLSFCR